MRQGNMDNKTKKNMIQFSKIIVSSLTFFVTVMCCGAIWLCHMEYSSNNIVDIIAHYIDFATVAFVSYSINSISEKAIINGVQNKRIPGLSNKDNEEDVG